MVLRQQLDGEMVLKQCDIRMVVDLVEECLLDFLAGKVLCVDNSFSGVSPFTAEIKAIVVCCREIHAQLDQFSDMLRAFPDHEGNHFAVTQPCAGAERVFYMESRTVVFPNSRCNASLGPVCIGCTAFFFCDDGYFCMISDMQSKI